jgi:hypothetical protein
MDPRDWSAFFSAEAGASATLAGLVTVAISINLTRILAVEHLPGRAGESLFALTKVLVVCGVALFPHLPDGVLGALALALSVVALTFGARLQIVSRRYADKGFTPTRQLVAAFGRLASAAPIGIGGALLLIHGPDGLVWLAAGVVMTLAVSVMNAWVLLVEIMR